eukprot:TRINITY_DN18560_c0_g1::TRINITY_DN18560_c0_g1_i1::g.1146::m.1146 TRINITY_DN18560_c0_g1::TRINITY_DN18560_c0_g1_i1::g.1146  ORF type:complete len:303 (+),score=39.02,sp/Q2KIJ5/KDSR_BOVIN/39.80/4e-61,adh_short/PF00106.20/1.3e-29,KR/PF08659.5/2.8e-18,NAD_binding_10/PF13460.1/0.039,Polysacc_synt_2/PF02719.10/0.028 TRINITY_DN18560_c0_g1_i1:75-983(+)
MWSSKSFKGEHILITGGSSGIGLETGKILVQERPRAITIVARGVSRLQEAKAMLDSIASESSIECKISFVSADLSKPQSAAHAVSQARDIAGHIDTLICCAGSSRPGYFEELPLETFETQMQLNYFSAVYIARHVYAEMKARKRGHLVFVSSLAGLMGVFGYTAYSASKFALRGFAESLYYEAKPYNVDVSLVFPADTNTPGFEEENKYKPVECVLQSQGAGLFTSNEMAGSLVRGIKRRDFFITHGFDSAMVGYVTSGMAPKWSCLEIAMMPFLKVYSIFYVLGLNRMFAREAEKRQSKEK